MIRMKADHHTRTPSCFAVEDRLPYLMGRPWRHAQDPPDPDLDRARPRGLGRYGIHPKALLDLKSLPEPLSQRFMIRSTAKRKIYMIRVALFAFVVEVIADHTEGVPILLVGDAEHLEADLHCRGSQLHVGNLCLA
jgi:hypothetical protein